jgi:hypothetical protein
MLKAEEQMELAVLKKHGRSIRGPGLRQAGNGIEGRSIATLSLEAAEQFRQPPEVHVRRGAEQALE